MSMSDVFVSLSQKYDSDEEDDAVAEEVHTTPKVASSAGSGVSFFQCAL